MVVFAHGSGSGRFSPRNQYVAQVLEEAGLATLLLDLLEEDEANDRSKVFDIALLADRLAGRGRLARGPPRDREPAPGLLRRQHRAPAPRCWRPAGRPSRSARSSRAAAGPTSPHGALPRVTAPTLLIVGGNDEIVLELNREAFDQLTGARQLEIVPGATHLFPEPGALEEVARLAREWFLHYLTPPAGK